MDSCSTQDLVSKAKLGCRQSFDSLVGKYCHRLKALIHLRLGVRLRQVYEVDDIFQITCLNAFRSVSTFECHNKGSFFKWLAGIAEHAILNAARGEANKSPPGPRYGNGSGPASIEELLVAKDPSPSKFAEQEERFERLKAALNGLSDDHREVIILARVQGLPIKDIALRLGRSADAVSMLLLRALRHLRVLFGSTDSFHLPPRSLESTPGPGPVPPAVPGTNRHGGPQARGNGLMPELPARDPPEAARRFEAPDQEKAEPRKTSTS